MLLKQITIQSDFFQMIKILTPTCRHEVLDAVLVYAFENRDIPMRPLSKVIFDIIRRDMDSQIYPEDKTKAEPMFSCIEPMTAVTLPGEVSRTEMPFPHLWEKMPYEVAPVIRPDIIPCVGDKGKCPYKTTLDSVPHLAETVVTVEKMAQRKKPKKASHLRVEVPVLRAKSSMNNHSDDSALVVRTIVMEKGKWRDVMERFVKTDNTQSKASHPMSQLPFMRDVRSEIKMKKACKQTGLKNIPVRKCMSKRKETLADKMTRWTRQFSRNLSLSKKPISLRDNLNIITVKTINTENAVAPKSYRRPKLKSEVVNNSKKPPYPFWPVTDEESPNKDERSCFVFNQLSQKNKLTQPIVLPDERAFNPFPIQGNYAGRISHGTH